jgi:CHAT domain-containing protein/tetratricopeptide (TPR) repeat protein
VDAWSISLAAGESVQVVVQQKGIDLIVALFSPEGEELVTVDGPGGAVGPEPLRIVSERSGEHRVEVRSPVRSAHAGGYTLRVSRPHPAEPRDRLAVEAQALHARAEALRMEGRSERVREALALFGRARELWHQAGDVDGEVRSLFALGLAHRELAELPQALAVWQEALQLTVALTDPGLEGVVLGASGIVHQMRGDLEAAAADLRAAAGIFRRIGNLGLEGSSIAPAGRVALRLGDLGRAQESFERALEIGRLTGNARSEALALNDLGYFHEALGDAPGALRYFEQALALHRSVGDRRKEAATLANLGRLQASPQAAFAEALRIYRELGDRYGEALVLGSLGAHEEALALHREVGDRLGEAAALAHLAAARAEKGEPAAALALYEQALAIQRELRHRAGEADVLHGMARARLAQGDLEQARELSAAGLEIVETLRAGLGSPEMRALYLGSVRDSYLTGIEILWRLHLERLALDLAERARARSLLDLLGEARADPPRGTVPSLAERERSLRRALAAKGEQQVRLLARPHAPEPAATLAREMDELIREHDRVQAEIRAGNPRLAELTRTLTSQEIQQLLDPDTLLLEYTLGDERSYLWLVSRDTVSGHELAGRAEIEEAARKLHRSLSAAPPAAWEEQAALLSRLVLGPVADRLGKRRLAVVADGALQYIPFAALGLLRDHEVVSLPAASALALLRAPRPDRTEATGTLAVFADPVFERSDPRVAGQAAAPSPVRPASSLSRSARDFEADGGRFQLARLLFSRVEAQGILPLAPADGRKALLDFDASLETALGPEIGRFRIVHFATHGLLDSVHPELSGLVLSLVDRDGRERPGFLSTLDAFDLKLNADLVVLSGCETALGKEIRAEGLVGLTRGFLYAGASAVVASLWKVDDAATAELMQRFYRALLGPEPLPPAAALRRAQLEMAAQRRWRHPFYWAAFVLQGDWSAE